MRAEGYWGEERGPPTHNEERGSEQHSFHPHIQVQRELQAEVICISKGFSEQAPPLLADAAHAAGFIWGLHLAGKRQGGRSHMEGVCLISSASSPTLIVPGYELCRLYT